MYEHEVTEISNRQFKFEVHHCLMYENRIPRKEFDSQVIFSVDY